MQEFLNLAEVGVAEGEEEEGSSNRLKWVDGKLKIRLVDGELHQLNAREPLRFVEPGSRRNPLPQAVTPRIFGEIVKYVKMQVSTAAGMLPNELGTRFPTDEIMQSWGLVYPHFWDESPSIRPRLGQEHVEVDLSPLADCDDRHRNVHQHADNVRHLRIGDVLEVGLDIAAESKAVMLVALPISPLAV
eukprot:gene8289-1559_t